MTRTAPLRRRRRWGKVRVPVVAELLLPVGHPPCEAGRAFLPMTLWIHPVRLARGHVTRLLGATLVALTVALVVLAARTVDRNGLNRAVRAQVGFAGSPRIGEVNFHITLDFLVDNPTFPTDEFSACRHGFWYVSEARTGDIYGIVQTVMLDVGANEMLIDHQQYVGRRALRVGTASQGGRPRPIEPYRLFPKRPTPKTAQVAQYEACLEQLLLLVCVAVAICGGLLLGRAWTSRRRVGPVGRDGCNWALGLPAASQGYTVHEIEAIHDGGLHLAVDRRPLSVDGNVGLGVNGDSVCSGNT